VAFDIVECGESSTGKRAWTNAVDCYTIVTVGSVRFDRLILRAE